MILGDTYRHKLTLFNGIDAIMITNASNRRHITADHKVTMDAFGVTQVGVGTL